MLKPIAVWVVALLLLTGCFRGDPNVTRSGKGRPRIEVTFPDTSPPGSVQTAVIEVSNPGPGDMAGLLVTFTLVGRPSTAGIPSALVGFGADGENPSIVAVDPRPQGVSDDGVVYRFEGLREGASTTISFDIKVPTELGPAGNSVIVSDAQEIDRADGVALQTTISG